MLFVTHDQSEAFAISDRICVLLNGRLRQTGTPTELFYKPADPEVARFFGCTNFIKGTILSGVFQSHFGSCATSLSDSSEAIAVIRPENIGLSSAKIDNGVAGRVTQVQFEGSTTRLTIETENDTFTTLSLSPDFSLKQSVWLHFPPDRLHIFPPLPHCLKP